MTSDTDKDQLIWVVIPAGGVGARFGADQPKQYTMINGHSLLWHTIQALRQHPRIRPIMLTIAETDQYWLSSDIAQSAKDIKTAPGGKTRAQSVLSGLDALVDHIDEMDWVLVHDACRPCVTLAELDALIGGLSHDKVGGILALPSTDTLKRVHDHKILETIDRATVWRALTPQLFRFGLLRSALEQATAAGVHVTDEASVIEWAGYQPSFVEGSTYNIKVTFPADIEYVRQFLLKE